MLVTNPEPATTARCALSRAEGPHLQLPIGDARDIGCGPKVVIVGSSPSCLTYVSPKAAAVCINVSITSRSAWTWN